jgi:pimeloyl-ACP methyl ester carboxylesterase
MELAEPDRATFLAVNKTRLRVWQWGDPSQPVVLFLHGGFDHGRMFDELAPRVSALGYHSVAVDARGHGDSGRLTSGTTWLTQVLDFAMLARQLGAPVGIVAHSMGGGQALTLAGAFPDLVRWIVNIDGLGPSAEVMIDPDDPAAAMNENLERALRIVRRPPREWESLEAMADQRGRINVRLPREWLLHLAEHGSAPGPNGGRVWKSDPILTIDMPSPFGYEQLLAQHRLVSCPVLVLTGDEPDTWNEVHGDELQRRVANMTGARLVHVPGTGHYVHIEDPDSTMRAIEAFVGEVGP